MADIPEQAKHALTAVPLVGQINSDGATAALFTRLTGSITSTGTDRRNGPGFHPKSTSDPLMLGKDSGKVIVEGGTTITIRWGSTGSVEKFTSTIGSGRKPMQGKWNDLEPLTA